MDHLTADDLVALRAEAQALGPDLVELRRSLHRNPELGLHLPRTQATVLGALAGLPLEVTTGLGLSSVTAVLRGGPPGPVVLLRADMDALPVHEDAVEGFASEFPGIMHACGHDLHVAALVGAARLLSARSAGLPGSVVLMFQPGEESAAGARVMLTEGLLEAAGSRPVAAYALHVTSALLPSGVVACRAGAALAAADTVQVVVRGRGGHASMPHLARDPVPAVCEMITALHTMTTRRLDPFDPVVLSVGTLSAGTAENVIAEEARFSASVRSFSEAARDIVLGAAEEVCRGVAQVHGVEVEVSVTARVPGHGQRLRGGREGGAGGPLAARTAALPRGAAPADRLGGLLVRPGRGARCVLRARRHAAGGVPGLGRVQPLAAGPLRRRCAARRRGHAGRAGPGPARRRVSPGPGAERDG